MKMDKLPRRVVGWMGGGRAGLCNYPDNRLFIDADIRDLIFLRLIL